MSSRMVCWLGFLGQRERGRCEGLACTCFRMGTLFTRLTKTGEKYEMDSLDGLHVSPTWKRPTLSALSESSGRSL